MGPREQRERERQEESDSDSLYCAEFVSKIESMFYSTPRNTSRNVEQAEKTMMLSL